MFDEKPYQRLINRLQFLTVSKEIAPDCRRLARNCYQRMMSASPDRDAMAYAKTEAEEFLEAWGL